MDPAYSRHSRRSQPNLQHLSLLPLTPQYPLLPTPVDDPPASTSYLAPKSLPATPSILSRSSSRTRLRNRSSHTLAGVDSAQAIKLTASKSSTSLAYSKQPRSRPTSTQTDDWLSQTATLLTSTTREEKGQAWLATRSSSTSLVGESYSHNRDPSNLSLDTQFYNGAEADDEYSPTSYRTPFNASRPQSRFASARNSRRESRVGLGVRTSGEEERGDVELMGGLEPDFVDSEELEEWEGEDEMDDGEVRRLIGVRVGGWVDWLVGWMDFRADETVEGDGEGEEDAEEKEKERHEGVRRRKRRDSERVIVGERNPGEMAVEKPPEEGEGREEGGGGWKDAAWLLSVATKIIT